jgi:hypothetical protein
MSIPMGAGHWIQRWVVLQDGSIKILFDTEEQAQSFIEDQLEDWGSKDE